MPNRALHSSNIGTVVKDEVESQHLRTMELTIRHKGTKAASLGMVKRVSAGPLG